MEDNMKFELVADKGVVDAIEKFAKSVVQMKKRGFSIGKISHFNGYSTVDIIANNGGIKPEDLFWLGWFSKGLEKDLKTQ